MINLFWLLGSDWLVIDPPNLDVHLDILSVGNHALWATDRDHTTWYKRISSEGKLIPYITLSNAFTAHHLTKKWSF